MLSKAGSTELTHFSQPNYRPCSPAASDVLIFDIYDELHEFAHVVWNKNISIRYEKYVTLEKSNSWLV